MRNRGRRNSEDIGGRLGHMLCLHVASLLITVSVVLVPMVIKNLLPGHTGKVLHPIHHTLPSLDFLNPETVVTEERSTEEWGRSRGANI